MGSTFGDILKRLRIEMSLSQDQLAEKLGTSKQVISRYEKNQRSPKVSTVEEYAEKLGVPVETFLSEAPSPDPLSELDGVQFALMSETKDMSEGQLADLLKFAKMLKSYDEDKKK